MQPKPAVIALGRSCIARGTGSSNPFPSSSESCKLRVAQMTEVILLVTGFSVAHDDSFDQHRSSPDTVEGDRRKYDCRADPVTRLAMV